jgi:hypothetical protein
MAVSKAQRGIHVVETAANGVLKTPKRDLDGIVDVLRDERRIVLHFHGGLVTAAAGRRIAESLQGTYRDAGAYPVFFVWHSGLLEVVRGNLGEIVEEEVFKVIEKWVAKFAAGKIRQEPGAKGLGIPTPSDNEVLSELALRRDGVEPYKDLQLEGVNELDPQEEDAFVAAVAADGDVRNATASIVDSVLPEEEVATSRGIEVARRRSRTTLMSPEVVAEFEREAAGAAEGQKGLISGALLARKAAHVLIRVVQRFRHRNDHGFYPTIFEEILREFYLGNVGAHVWAEMKGETKDTFDAGSPTRGGRYFMSRLGELIRAGHSPEVTLVGHSTGAVFIDNLLRHVEAMRKDPEEALPEGFRFKNLIFLAPACTFEDFASTVEGHGELFDRFRMFTMADAAECKDWLLSFVYPRSLLYFISGVLETEADGSSSSAKPLVGLNRYYGAPAADEAPALALVRDFIGGDETRVVWSPSTNGEGFASGAVHHSDFDDDEEVRASLSYLISHA